MKKKVCKALATIMSAIAVSTLLSTVAFADDSVVTKTQDNVTVTKTASWAQVDGKTTDSKGNPYIKIDFKVDATKIEDNDLPIGGGDTDIVLVLDNSMSYKDRFPKAKEAVNKFVDDVMSLQTDKVKVGIVKFGKTATTMIGLSDNMTEVKKAVDKIELQGDSISGTNMHHGVCNAKDLLKASTAKTKVIIVLSDGRANRTKDNIEQHNRDNARKKVKEELEEAKKEINNLQVATVGYLQKDDEDSRKFLEEIATKDTSGKKMFYTTGDIAQNISSIFNTISQNITRYVVGKSLVDVIPKECSMLENTIKVSDANIKYYMTANNQIVKFCWEKTKIEKKVYNISFITVLDKTKLNTKQLAGEEKLNTNGTTIDINVNTSGSSFFLYSNKGILNLESPKLLYKENEKNVNINDNKNNSNEKAEEKVNKDEMDDTPSTGDEFDMTTLGLAILTASILLGVCICIRRS